VIAPCEKAKRALTSGGDAGIAVEEPNGEDRFNGQSQGKNLKAWRTICLNDVPSLYIVRCNRLESIGRMLTA
jgi:hypothetical protein